MEKTMAEMNNRELFSVLTGSRGIMAQMMLQNVVKDYRRRNMTGTADLSTMVQDYLSHEHNN